MSPAAEGRFDGRSVEALEADHHEPTRFRPAGLPGPIEVVRDAAPDALADEAHGPPADGHEALDPQDALRLRGPRDPGRERFRLGDRRDRDRDALEVVV